MPKQACLGSTLLSVLTAVATTVSAQAQSVIYVDDDAPSDPGPCDATISDPEENGSAAHPFDAVQEGIDAATNGDTVLVADGTYTGDGNRDLDFGGRLITLRSENGPENCIIDCQGSYLDPHRGFYFHSGETSASILDGLTIANGSTASPMVVGHGGGIYCNGSSPTIINCVITNCTILGNMTHEGSGGGIYTENSSPLIASCVIENCGCSYWSGFDPIGGGAIYCFGGAPQIIANRIVDCFADVSCIDGGGAIGFRQTNILIEGNAILDCYAHGRGGGIAGTDSEIDISHNIIAGCMGFHRGGGLALMGSFGSVSNNLIVENETFELGGGVFVSGDATDLEIAFCTVAANAAGFSGGGIRIADSAPVGIHDCIVWGNTAYDGAQIWPSTLYTVTYCDVQGGWPGEGNIDADPLFVPGPAGCYYLSQITAGQMEQSPCVDAGDPASPLIDGTTRSDEGPDAGLVDMGHHYPVTGLPLVMGDFDRDGDVDLADFAEVQSCFTGEGPTDVSPCCRVFDFEPDDDVDLDDYAQFHGALTGP